MVLNICKCPTIPSHVILYVMKLATICLRNCSGSSLCTSIIYSVKYAYKRLSCFVLLYHIRIIVSYLIFVYLHSQGLIWWPKFQSNNPLIGCHNGHDGVSNHDCLLNRLFRHRSKKTPRLRATGLVRGIHRWPVNSQHKWPVTQKRFPSDDTIIHHGYGYHDHSQNTACDEKPTVAKILRPHFLLT